MSGSELRIYASKILSVTANKTLTPVQMRTKLTLFLTGYVYR